jgi:hypothetical protein
MSPETTIQPWGSPEIPAIDAATPTQIVSYASPQLAKKDIQAIAGAFESGSYEMAATYVWTKAAAVLKKQVAMLGMGFVGEMLGRPDLNEDSDPTAKLSDREAVSLAEDLGMVNGTSAFRLNQALALVTHFTKLSTEEAEAEAMHREEAVILLKTCVSSILSRPNFEGAMKFADFREKLSSITLREEECTGLTASPYFFLRTTLGVLLSLVKTAKGASHEHALGNISVVLPVIWPLLRQPEKWQVGQAYAEVTSEGKRAASTGLKAALVKVHGFDFVPESLRSNTFTDAASKVLAAHYGFNNFYTEEEPMLVLANLGTAIPKPAFAKVMEASLAVWLGNRWNYAYASAPLAEKIFDSLRREQWEYYITECLQGDKSILDKLSQEDRPVGRWIELIPRYFKTGFSLRDPRVIRLMNATNNRDAISIKSAALQLRSSV